MQYKCDKCYDTGSRDQIGTYLDCNECGVAQTRRDLNDFVKSLGPTHPEDVALAIHQRALARAPKQETDHINDVVKMVAPAGWKLVPEDPTGDMFRAAAKIDNEMFAGGSSHGAEDGQVWAAMYDAAPESPVAAPAAANGTLTDADILTIIWKYSSFISVGNYSSTQFDCQADTLNCVRAILAAAGLDAALVKALEEVIVADWPACNPGCDYEDPYGGMHDHRSKICVCEAAKESIARQRAALSGAKGN